MRLKRNRDPDELRVPITMDDVFYGHARAIEAEYRRTHIVVRDPVTKEWVWVAKHPRGSWVNWRTLARAQWHPDFVAYRDIQGLPRTLTDDPHPDTLGAPDYVPESWLPGPPRPEWDPDWGTD